MAGFVTTAWNLSAANGLFEDGGQPRMCRFYAWRALAVLLFSLLAVFFLLIMTILDQTSRSTALSFGDLTTLVGRTPLIPLRRVSDHLPEAVRVYAKLEWFNPGGSVKDRPALNIIQTALANGDLQSGKRLLDSTSGNMGISYATFGAALGIPVTLTIPANVSQERLTVLHALGAEVILTDAGEGTDGAILEARRLASEFPHIYWYAHQYDNAANWQAHYKTTGPEIFDQSGALLTHFVTGLGTSGTLMGAGRYLREKLPSLRLVGVQPDASFHGLEGLKHMQSAIKPGIFDESFPDEIVEVRTVEAYEMVLKLARSEGLFVGISSGAAALAALRIAERLQAGVIVTLFPDAGYKYLSEKELWKGA